jgi:hypothetical protein
MLKSNYSVILLTLLIPVYIILAIVFSPIPRGSDQYWYVGNVNRVIHIDGKYKTNNIFPASLPESDKDLPRPWVQNRPVVYIVTAFAFLIGDAHRTWVILNILFLLLSVYLVYKIIKRDVDQSSNLTPQLIGLLLLFPINFYLVMQAYPDIFNELLVIALVVLLLSNVSWIAKAIGAAVLTGLLIYQRDNFLLLVFLLPFYFFFYETKNKRLVSGTLFILLTLLLYYIKPMIFALHTTKPLNILSVITEVRPGRLNMVNYLYPDLPQESLSETFKILPAKAWAAISKQFSITGRDAIFYYIINLLFIPYILLMPKYKKFTITQRKVLFLGGCFIVLYFITIILFENQYRFASVLIPFLLLSTYWYLAGFSKKQVAYFISFALLGIFILIDIFIGVQNRKEAISDKALISKLYGIKKEINNKPVLIQYYTGRALLIAYGLSPNLCYYFPSDADTANLAAVCKRLGTDLLIFQKQSEVYERLKGKLKTEQPIDEKLILAETDLLTK